MAISRYRVIVVCGVFGGVLVCPGSHAIACSLLRRPWGLVVRVYPLCVVVWLSRRLWGWCRAQGLYFPALVCYRPWRYRGGGFGGFYFPSTFLGAGAA